MMVDCCTKVCKKALFLPAFRDYRRLLHHRCPYSAQLKPVVSCRRIHNMVRHCHGATAEISYQKLDHRSLVRVGGTDVLSFLQGLVTNDVRQLETPDCAALYAMMLNVQGRVLCDLLLYRMKAETFTVLMECQRDVTSDLISTLLRYKLRKKIDISDVGDDFKLWSVFSEFHSMPDIHMTSRGAVCCVDDPRRTSFGRRLVLPSNVDEPSFDECSVVPGDYHTWRCRAGVGEGTVDFPPSQSFPLESNLDFMNGVSFSKGCYIGQELTARTNYTGVIRKRIMPLIISGATQDVKPGAVVVNAGGKECGKVRTVSGSRALGLLRIDDVVGKGRMEVQVEDSKVADAETYIPSWWPTSSDAVVQHAVARNERASTKD